MADEYEEDYDADIVDEPIDDGEDDEVEVEPEEDEEVEDDSEEPIDQADEYVSDIDDGDLTEFQKMLINKQNKEFRTANRYTKYEPVALIGYRAQQIAEGAVPLTEIGALTDPASIAAKEFAEGKIPYLIERMLPSNKIGKYTYETRSPDELINVNHMI